MRMFSELTVREVAIIIGLVGQLIVQTGVVFWWGSQLNTTVSQVVRELQSVRAEQREAADDLTDLRIRLAVEEALSMRYGTLDAGGGR